jgi:hypothetical protein
MRVLSPVSSLNCCDCRSTRLSLSPILRPGFGKWQVKGMLRTKQLGCPGTAESSTNDERRLEPLKPIEPTVVLAVSTRAESAAFRQIRVLGLEYGLKHAKYFWLVIT